MVLWGSCVNGVVGLMCDLLWGLYVSVVVGLVCVVLWGSCVNDLVGLMCESDISVIQICIIFCLASSFSPPQFPACLLMSVAH